MAAMMTKTPKPSKPPKPAGTPRTLNKYRNDETLFFTSPTPGVCSDPQRRNEFGRVERIIGAVTHLGVPTTVSALDLGDGTTAEVSKPIAEVLEWCRRCPIIVNCFERMVGSDYTGIAGGTVLHKGMPYRPRIERAQQRREEEDR